MPADKISDKQIEQILERLKEGKRVRRSLLSDGRLHIDRKLPFLIVYRLLEGETDPGTSRLVKGEASYLIAPSSNIKKNGVLGLIKKLTRILSDEFGSFLIIEIWSKEIDRSVPSLDVMPPKPTFKLYIPQKQPPTKTIEVFERSLKRVKILKRHASVEFDYWNRSSARSPLIPQGIADRMNCSVLGLEIEDIYRDPDTNEVFPLVLRRLHRSVSTALKRAAFEFTKNRTTRKPFSYHVMGRRAFVKAVWAIDKQLAHISQSFDFLLQVTPINTDQAWRRFQKNRFEKMPIFYYRPLPVDPGQLKRQLYQIPIEKVEDATLAFLFREKQMEIDRQLTMLLDRGKKSFFYGSLQLYGEVTESLLHTAKNILDHYSAHAENRGVRDVLNAEEFAVHARKEILYYQAQYPELAARVEIRDDISGVLVSQGNFLIPSNISIASDRVEALLNHEIGTHILTYYNGKAQPFHQLYCGLAGYDELQEGLAVLAEFFVDGLGGRRLRFLAGRVLAAYRMQSGATFSEVFHDLSSTYGFEQRNAFIMAMRIFRGGGFMKDAIYLRGLINLLEYLKNGGNIELLYCGKMSLDHVGVIRELQARKIISSHQLTPRYMEMAGVEKKLAALENGLELFDLVDWRQTCT